jgi:hypothetical protein
LKIIRKGDWVHLCPPLPFCLPYRIPSWLLHLKKNTNWKHARTKINDGSVWSDGIMISLIRCSSRPFPTPCQSQFPFWKFAWPWLAVLEMVTKYIAKLHLFACVQSYRATMKQN